MSEQKNLDFETLEELKQEQARISNAIQQGDLKSGYDRTCFVVVEYCSLLCYADYLLFHLS